MTAQCADAVRWLAIPGWLAPATNSKLEALVKLADQARTTIQVVPYSAGAHPGQLSPFVILGFPRTV